MGYNGSRKQLKWFASFSKFETSLLLIKSGEMAGMFLPLKSFDHYDTSCGVI